MEGTEENSASAIDDAGDKTELKPADDTSGGCPTAAVVAQFEQGDFVRVSERGCQEVKRLLDRSKDLGHIVKVHHDGVDADGLPCVLYDVEWPVIGGTLTNIAECHLKPTSPFEEGLTVTRRRETKKPKLFGEDDSASKPKPENTKPKVDNKAHKPEASKKGAVPPKSSALSQNPASKAKPKPAAKKKTIPKSGSTSTKRKNGSDAKSAANKKCKTVASAVAEKPSSKEDVGVAPKGMDLYEKQRREFDRIMARLEKVDQFGWFWDTAPPEYDEKYGNEGTNTPKNTSDEASSESRTNPSYPDHAPYNWEMIRRRKASGRYVLDRVAQEQERYSQIMEPCRKFLRRGQKKSKENPRVLYPMGVHWELFLRDVFAMIDAANERVEDPTAGAHTSLEVASKKLRDAVKLSAERTGERHERVLSFYDDRHRFDAVLRKHRNTEAAMQSWRRVPFPERRYERLGHDVVSVGLSDLDERIASYELRTSLPDSFVGMSYRYDDTGESEAWMQSVVDDAGPETQGDEAKEAATALAADKGVVRAQVVATMQSLLIGVQDRVMTDMSVLNQSELVSANWVKSDDRMQIEPVGDRDSSSTKANATPEIVEQPVWGIDCYTRQNILLCLESELDPITSLSFLEKWLLPAINACPPEVASDISNAARILEGLPFKMPSEETVIEKMIEEENAKESVQHWSNTVLGQALTAKINSQGPPWLKASANIVRRARESLGPDFFRVHPKGHGSVLLCQRVKPNSLVTFYRGEIYPAWRWGEKMDAIEITQQRKGLRPMLPDFYNMALERPQLDPRGYGLLFVDASRKGGHGSSLSHSCQPTCEVRVAAKDGGLCLAMTTLRDLEMGEELTFDYNAATDSLNEYQSAVCLCGHGKCRRSFLHFATAECYQKVMNRNYPIASRFSNLIKGCMKKVMSDDDKKVLNRHGFRTAAFGAISVNRHDTESVNNDLSDTLDIVPVWLKTYAAETLRYIEYERRALPITLIRDQISRGRSKGSPSPKKGPAKKRDAKGISTQPRATDKKLTKTQQERIDEPKKKARKEPVKPENTLSFFARHQSDRIMEFLNAKGFDKTGKELMSTKRSIAKAYWENLSEEKKEFWKKETLKEFELRKKRWKSEENVRRKSTETSPKKGSSISDGLESSKSGFQDADAEGISAMEHRIQHLTQALSRVGRVLDRHREKQFQEGNAKGIEGCVSRDAVHSPLRVLNDAEVIERLWSDNDSLVSILSRFIRTGDCVPKGLRDNFAEVVNRYRDGLIKSADLVTPSDREVLKRGLLELRTTILENVRKMVKVFRKYKAQLNSEKDSPSTLGDNDDSSALDSERDNTLGSEIVTGNGADVKKDEENGLELPDGQCRKSLVNGCKSSVNQENASQREAQQYEKTTSTTREEVRRCLDQLVDTIGGLNSTPQQEIPSPSIQADVPSKDAQHGIEREDRGEEKKTLTSSDILKTNPWIIHYGERIALEAAADVLLLYASTSNFFTINPYATLQSTPIEVYARELGNSVPKTAIDKEQLSPGDAALLDSTNLQSKSKSAQTEDALLCCPDDIVAKVTVQYNSDYVLSQLLQWYNGGIGQKPGLPDLSGCVTLPHISGCWLSKLIPQRRITTDRKTVYDTKIRRKLIEWLQDPFKRGNPLPDDVKQAFQGSSPLSIPMEKLLFGSPVLDFLVMGDENNIYEALEELDRENKVSARGAVNDKLSTVDRGRPAQAVCRWVQCENPDCLKWRRIPWHVDIDLLPEAFFCKDNVWEPERMSCDAPEDDWDVDDKLVGADGKVDESPTRKKKRGPALPTREEDFMVGAKFDVRRKMRSKEKYMVATVTHIDFSGKVKRVRFHFQKTRAEADEWIEFGSDRIAVLHSMTADPKREVDGATKKENTVQTKSAGSKEAETGSESKKTASQIEETAAPSEVSSETKADGTSRRLESDKARQTKKPNASKKAKSLPKDSKTRAKLNLQKKRKSALTDDNPMKNSLDEKSTEEFYIPKKQKVHGAIEAHASINHPGMQPNEAGSASRSSASVVPESERRVDATTPDTASSTARHVTVERTTSTTPMLGSHASPAVQFIAPGQYGSSLASMHEQNRLNHQHSLSSFSSVTELRRSVGQHSQLEEIGDGQLFLRQQLTPQVPHPSSESDLHLLAFVGSQGIQSLVQRAARNDPAARSELSNLLQQGTSTSKERRFNT